MKTVSNVYAVCAFAAIGTIPSNVYVTCLRVRVCFACTNKPKGGGLFGMDIASMSGVLGTNGYKNYFRNPKSYTQGYITAAMPFGSIFGTLSSSFFSDRFSRKVAIQVCCLLWIIGSS